MPVVKFWASVAALVTGPAATIALILVGLPGTIGDAMTWISDWIPTMGRFVADHAGILTPAWMLSFFGAFLLGWLHLPEMRSRRAAARAMQDSASVSSAPPAASTPEPPSAAELEQRKHIADTVRWLCESGLDPASFALQPLVAEKIDQLQSNHPDLSPVLCMCNRIIPDLLNKPREEMHDFILGDRAHNIDESIELLKQYYIAYMEHIQIVVRFYLNEKRNLVQKENYKNWKQRYLELKRKIDGLGADVRLDRLHSKFSCWGWPVNFPPEG